MRKLLSASFSRLWKDKVFWVANIVFMPAASLLFGLLNYRTAQTSNEPVWIEDVLFNLLPMASVACAVSISMFLGTEFDNGTIRNKLIVGHTRPAIYFSSLIACTAASFLALAGALLVSGIMGAMLFAGFRLQVWEITYTVFCAFLVTAAFSAIHAAMAMNCHNKAYSVVVAVVLIFGLLMLASFISGRLIEPEMIHDGITISTDGVEYGDLVDNPNYVGGSARKVMEFIYDLLPTGQAAQLSDLDLVRAGRWPWLSAGVCIAATAAGFAAFRRKDIK